jgi:hypothetical protein
MAVIFIMRAPQSHVSRHGNENIAARPNVGQYFGEEFPISLYVFQNIQEQKKISPFAYFSEICRSHSANELDSREALLGEFDGLR